MPYKYSIFHLLIFLLTFCCLTGQNLSNSTQDKLFEEDFKSRYSSTKYNYEGRKIKGIESNTSNGKYAEYAPNQPDLKEDNNSHILQIDSSIKWVFLIILLIAVIYIAVTLLTEGGNSWFSSKQNKSLSDYRHFNVETASGDEFMTLIDSAEEENNFRLAIRYYFLLALKNMSLKNIIKIEEDKTNSEYLSEINNTELVKKFSAILYLYNYTWYGEFDINKLQYKTAKSNFITFLNHIK